MNFVAGNPRRIPAKFDSTAREGNGNGVELDRRRRSSASNDVEAFIFSSMQELEANNGLSLCSFGPSPLNLMSRGGMGGAHIGGIIGTRLGTGGGHIGGSGPTGVGGSHNWGEQNQTLAPFHPHIRSNSTRSNDSDNIESLLDGVGCDLASASVALPPMPSSLRYPPNDDLAVLALRRIEMEEMLLEQQDQKRDLLRGEHNDAHTSHHHFRETISLGRSHVRNLNFGYAPVRMTCPMRDDDYRQLQQHRLQSLQQQQRRQQQQQQQRQRITSLLEQIQGQRLGQRAQKQQRQPSRSSSHSSITTMDFTPEEILLEVKRRKRSLNNSMQSIGEALNYTSRHDLRSDIDEGGDEERERERGITRHIDIDGASALKANADLMNMFNQIHNGRIEIFPKNTRVVGGGEGRERKGGGGRGEGEGEGEIGEYGGSSVAKTIRRQRPKLPLSSRTRSETLSSDREMREDLGPISKRGRQRCINSTNVNSDVSGKKGDNYKKTDEDGNNTKKKKKKKKKHERTNNTSSLDILLCAFTHIDRKENAVSDIPAKEDYENSSLSVASSVGMTDGCNKDNDVISPKESSHHSDTNTSPQADTHATSSQSLMSWIEMKVMRDNLVLSERARWEQKLHDIQLKMQQNELTLNAMRERLTRSAAMNGGGSISGMNADLRSLLEGNTSGIMDSERVELGPVVNSAGGSMSLPSSSSSKTDKIHAMLARMRGFPVSQAISSHSDDGIQDDNEVTSSRANPIAVALRPPSPEPIRPEDALQLFFDTFGEDAKKSCEDMLRAISETEKSLISIHAWDRSQGLRKCHSRTVVKTRRSRAQIKAFLMGVEAPRDLHKKRKRNPKNVKEQFED